MFFKELPSFETLLKSSERYPDMDVKACVTWIHIVHAGAILKRRIERELYEEGLSYNYLIVMVILASENKCVPISSLAKMSCVTTDTIFPVIAAMERDGLVRLTTEPTDMHPRFPGADGRLDNVRLTIEPTDRHTVLVELTPEGRDTINKIAPVFFENQSAVMAGLDEAELCSLFLLLSKINLEL